MSMPKLPRSLRHQLTLVLVAATFFALCVAGIGLVLFDLQRQSRGIQEALAAQADIVGLASSAALAFDDERGAAENLRALRAIPSVAVAALYAADGRRLALFTQDTEAEAPAQAPADMSRLDRSWIRVARPVMLNSERIGTVYLQARHNLAGRAMEHLAALLVILVGSLAAAVPVANRLHAGVTAPLQELSRVSRGIMQGDFGLRAVRARDDEVGAVVEAFNAMVDELGRRAATLQEANQALRASEERYQLAVRGSSAGLWDWDLRAGTMFYSPRLKQLLGYDDAEFPDLPASIRLVADEAEIDKVKEALRAHFGQGKPYQVELRVRPRSGEERWLLIAGISLREPDGRPFRMAGSVIDVTERRQAENVLRDANRAKDEFLATLAHELRNPLAPIRTSLEILKLDMGGAASERARATMERQVVHMVRLIDDLLDISRITSGKIHIQRAPLRLREAIDSALEISRPALEAGEHELQVEIADPDIALEGDATRLAQSVGNLLNNAAKYTPRGGRVRLKMLREGDTAVIQVSDNGVGIPPHMLEQVFCMFTQVDKTLDRAQGGLGIGLSLVRSLVGLHGGTVHADSAGPGCGSTFTIRLPCLPAAASASASAPPVATPVAASGIRVLVADDNTDAAESLASVLQMLGHVTCSVHTPEAAIRAAAEFRPDVMLLDIGMPGMTGYELARRLRADGRFAGARLVAVTGWGSEVDRARSREAGFDHHLTKPVDLQALLGVLETSRPNHAVEQSA